MTDPFDRSLPSPIASVLAKRASAVDAVSIAGKIPPHQERVAIDTGVEEAVRAAGTDPSIHLIVVSGSAGDGKSFTIGRVLARSDSPWAAHPDRVIEDATHSERPDQDQLERLEGFFAPLATGLSILDGPPLLIAMNTGMVIRFFNDLHHRGDDRFGPLRHLAAVLLTGLGVPHDHGAAPPAYSERVLVVNLDDRPTTGEGARSMFGRILAAMDPADPAGVMAGAPRCATCTVKNWCWVRTNAEIAAHAPVASALDGLAHRAALERARYISPRSLWDLAAAVVTGGHTFSTADPCDTVAAVAAMDRPAALELLWKRTLPNGVFIPGSAPPGLPTEIQALDPTYVAASDWHDRIAATGISRTADAAALGCLRPAGVTAAALATLTEAIAADHLQAHLGKAWHAQAGRSIARAGFLASAGGPTDTAAQPTETTTSLAANPAPSDDLAEFAKLLDEYETATSLTAGSLLEQLEDLIGHSLAGAFGKEIRGETYVRIGTPGDKDVIVQVRAGLKAGTTHEVTVPDPRRARNPAGATAAGYRPLAIEATIDAAQGAKQRLSITFPLFKLFRDIERRSLPSATDLERFFALRRAAAAVSARAATDHTQPLLLADRRNGRLVRLEPSDRHGQTRFNEQEMT